MKVLYAPARQRVPSKAFEWSNGTYSLLLDATLELELTLDEDFAELLDVSAGSTSLLLLDFTELLDFAVDPFDSADAPLRVTLEEEDSSSMLLDDSSSRGAKLLSSSQAAKRKILAIKNTIPMCPTHFNDDKSPNFFICPPSKSFLSNIIKNPSSSSWRS